MQKEKIGMENGRTMAEMLGVLALIGVLSIGGIVGYGYAMRLYQEAETLDQLSVLIAGGRSGDIPLHYGFKTVGLSDGYVPYIVPIRDVISKVRYRSEETAFDAGLTDEEGMLVLKDPRQMHEVREYESFDTLLDTPAWLRAEDENNWTVRVTGLSYALCEKLLIKKDLGFDYAYVALQNADKSPSDPLMGDFSLVGKENKYANPDRGGEEVVATREQIDKVCSMIDPTKGNISLAQKYIRSLGDENKTGIAPGAEAVCENKKSLACMAYGARVDVGEKNEDGSKKMTPLQTLVLYFGKDRGIESPIPVPETCVPGTPYTEESGGTIESQECCEALGDDVVFIPGVPKCCKLVEDIENTPRCKVGPDGRYVARITAKTDTTGKPVLDENGIPVYEETWVFDTDAITSEEEIYVGVNWAGKLDESCCPGAVPVTPPTVPCHVSSITGAVLPWTIATSKGATSTQYKNCPLGSSTQTSEVTIDQCCIAGGGYWAEADGQVAGTDLTSETGKALCCSQNDVLAFRTVSTTDQCPWEGVSNVPTLGTSITGAAPLDIMGTPTTDCCYKMEGLQKRLKTAACAYEGGVLKYSQECCNVATDMNGRKLSYVYAPNVNETHTYDPTVEIDNSHPISQECGVIAAAPTSVSEPDRNCCVDYKELERSGTALTYNQQIKDWSGMPSPEYCCQTLIGTSLASNEREMKKHFQQCCESELYFNTQFKETRRKGKFIPAGTHLRSFQKNRSCPEPYSGETCGVTNETYTTSEDICCELHTGKSIDGVDNKACCLYLSTSSGRYSKYWDEETGQCLPCGVCDEIPNTDNPDDEKCYDYCLYQVSPTNGEPEQDVTPPTVTNTCITNNTGCWIGRNNACCQEKGFEAAGARSCNCCPDPDAEGVTHGDDCFFLKDTPSRMDPKTECLGTTIIPGTTPGTTPGIINPGVITPEVTIPVTVKRKVRTYDCPEGVAPGTGTEIGWCEPENTSEGAE